MEPLTDLPGYLFRLYPPIAFPPPSIRRGDLRVARKVDILCAIGNKLH
jgi:hypothetical protein